MGKLVSDEVKALFPLNTINSVEKFFSAEIRKGDPNLALISIVLGAIEHSLTQVVLPTNVTLTHKKTSQRGEKKAKIHYSAAVGKITEENEKSEKNGSIKAESGDEHEEETVQICNTRNFESELPPLQYETVEALYEKFQCMIVGAVDLTQYNDEVEDDLNGDYAFCSTTASSNGKSSDSDNVHYYIYENQKPSSRNLVKKVSDVVWSNLSTTYGADKPHLQNLYAYLVGKKLDSFGVALAVVAGCQILGISDVHLALSEDHAWVYFGKNGQLTAEVTWHGKGHEDRRGQPAGVLESEASSWLYLKGFSIKCSRHTETASIVSAINPVINHIADSLEIGVIQQKLLWILYDAGHLQKYPMAIATLADLQEVYPTTGKSDCEYLYKEAINSAVKFYNNMHVYPYTYYGAHLYRKEDFKGAIKLWADAADVITNYSYTRHDEEIYKEFMEINKDYIGNIIRKSSTGISATSLTRDTNSFGQLLRFFDGICLWEESSKNTQVVHIIWAKAWNHAIGKFDSSIRKQLNIVLPTIEKGDKAAKQFLPSSVGQQKDLAPEATEDKQGSGPEDPMPVVTITFRSQKMQGIKDLLQQEKFNPGTVTLHLTAMTLVSGPSYNEVDNQDGISGRTRKMKSHSNDNRNFPDALLKTQPAKRARKQ